MKCILLASATTLLLSVGSASAASLFATDAASFGMGYVSGYVFPNDGSPSGDAPTAVYSPPPTQADGHFHFSRVYLYPPAEGDDSNG